MLIFSLVLFAACTQLRIDKLWRGVQAETKEKFRETFNSRAENLLLKREESEFSKFVSTESAGLKLLLISAVDSQNKRIFDFVESAFSPKALKQMFPGLSTLILQAQNDVREPSLEFLERLSEFQLVNYEQKSSILNLSGYAHWMNESMDNEARFVTLLLDKGMFATALLGLLDSDKGTRRESEQVLGTYTKWGKLDKSSAFIQTQYKQLKYSNIK